MTKLPSLCVTENSIASLSLLVRETGNYVERVVIGVWFVIASVVCLVRTFYLMIKVN